MFQGCNIGGSTRTYLMVGRMTRRPRETGHLLSEYVDDHLADCWDGHFDALDKRLGTHLIAVEHHRFDAVRVFAWHSRSKTKSDDYYESCDKTPHVASSFGCPYNGAGFVSSVLSKPPTVTITSTEIQYSHTLDFPCEVSTAERAAALLTPLLQHDTSYEYPMG